MSKKEIYVIPSLRRLYSERDLVEREFRSDVKINLGFLRRLKEETSKDEKAKMLL